eukprot:421058-Prymnesium_polylepis.1
MHLAQDCAPDADPPPESAGVQCFVAGCTHVPFRTKGFLDAHLHLAHPALSAADLATHGYTRCPARAGCTKPVQDLTYKSSNAANRSSFFDHLHRLKDGSDATLVHRAVIGRHGDARQAADAARATAASLARPDSVDATLTSPPYPAPA